MLQITPPVIPTQETAVPLAEALSMAKAYEEPLHAYAFSSQEALGAKLAKTEYKGCTFRACRFTGADFTGAFFQNCVFDGCDFSGAVLMDATLQKCSFHACKLAGANYSGAALTDVSFTQCMAENVCFAACLCKNVLWQGCNLQRAALGDLHRRSRFAFDATDLRSADFLHTPLKDVRFTTCEIDGITLEGPELRGAVVTALQACELARLLGVIIQ